MRTACAAAIVAAAGMSPASAQQTIAPASATPVPGPMPEILQKYTPVTAERLKKPEDGNWLHFRRTYDGWGYSPLAEITPANVSRLQPVWSYSHRPGRGPPGAADREQRRHVRGDARQSAARARGQDRQPAVALQAAVPRGHDPAASDQPWRRTMGRQGAVRGGGGGPGCARRQDRQGGMDHEGRRLQGRPLHVARAAHRRRQGAGRAFGRRVGHPRLPRRLRCGDRQAALEDVCRAGAGRARQRHLAGGRRALQARRRHHVGHRQLRSGDQSHLLGHRQCRAVVRRPASRRQPLHDLRGRFRRHQWRDQGPLPISPEQLVGLGRGLAADRARLHPRRTTGERSRQCLAQRLPLAAGAHRRTRSTSSPVNRM